MLSRRLILSAIALSAMTLVNADGYNHSIFIPGWQIETSEMFLTDGVNYPYPVWYLVDGNPNTTWVYSAKDYPKPVRTNLGNLTGDYYVRIQSTKDPVVLDELRIMTGYNKSSALYYKNSRPVEVEIFDQFPYDYTHDGKRFRTKPLRRVSLEDKPGIKSLKLPKKSYSEIYVVFSKIKKGPIDDLCVSEIMPRAGGKNVIPKVNSFIYTRGSDCGCGGDFELRKTSGPVIATANYEFPKFTFSPDGQYVAGLRYGQPGSVVWIAEVASGKKLWQRRISEGQLFQEPTWTNSKFILPFGKNGKLVGNSMPWIPLGTLVWKNK